MKRILGNVGFTVGTVIRKVLDVLFIWGCLYICLLLFSMVVDWDILDDVVRNISPFVLLMICEVVGLIYIGSKLTVLQKIIKQEKADVGNIFKPDGLQKFPILTVQNM